MILYIKKAITFINSIYIYIYFFLKKKKNKNLIQ